MRSIRHWTLRYINDRLAVMAHERLHPQDPWLTLPMVNILQSWLHPDDVGLEFGSGRSTLWFLERVGFLTSVEQDPEWFGTVSAQCANRGLTNIDYRLLPDGISQPDSPPFADYVAVASEFGAESLDFCLIDGAARDRCAQACLDKLKPGGILIIDDVNWYFPTAPKSIAPSSRGLDDGYASEVGGQSERRSSRGGAFGQPTESRIRPFGSSRCESLDKGEFELRALQ